MEDFLQEVKKALDGKLYLIALQACLTIPDMCGAVQSYDGKATRKRYCKWYDKYAKPKVNCEMNALDCYLFRCSMAHQGSTVPSPKDNRVPPYSRIVFIAPDNQSIWLHNNIMNEALNIDLHVFCNGIIEAAYEWINIMKETNDENYANNICNIIRLHPNGMLPYTLGLFTIT